MNFNAYPIVTYLVTLIILLGPIEAKELDLPDIGDSHAAHMTPAKERRTGETVMRNLRRNDFIVDDPLLMSYINSLGYQLLSNHDGELTHEFYFFIVRDREINAFALPGGFVGINYGLIILSESESELASVVAHEIAHVTQRHYARAYDIRSDSELPILAAIIAMIALGSSGDSGDLGEAIITSSIAANAQRSINFTRQNEEEADRIGINLLHKSSFNAMSMAQFFEKMDKEARLHGATLPEFLRTHPVNVSRINDARNRASQHPYQVQRSELDFHLMRYRVIALSSRDRKQALTFFEEEIANTVGEQQTAAKYGYVLTCILAGNYKQAHQYLTPLLRAEPHRIAYLLAEADLYIAQGKTTRAIEIYETALILYPNNEPITYDYIALLIELEQFQKAQPVLQNILKTHPYNPVFYKHMAKVQSRLGQDGKSHEALAEYYYQIGQFHQALEQIELALKINGLDFYTSSRLESRRLEIQEEIPKNNN